MPEGGAAPRELNNSMTGVLLSYLRRVGSEETVTAVLGEAGEARSLGELEDPTNWSSYEQTRRLFAAAARVLDDPGVGRAVGEELLSRYASSEVVELLRSLEQPGDVLRVIAEIATKQSTVTVMSCVQADDRHGVVSARTKAPIRREPLFCDYTAGVLAAVPTIFGMAPGTVVETECQRRGNTRCLYQVGWDPDTATDPTARIHFLTAKVAALTSRFEALEHLASELVSVSDVDQALDIIAQRAGVAVRAPGFLLAVQLPREDGLRIHHVGLDDASAARFAAEVLRDPPDDHDGARLIVDVASSSHTFGRIAALFPDGQRFLPEERQLFEAYAGHAAAALDTAAALADARERARTIGALFDLATALSEVGSVEAVAERLADAVPAVTDCEEACVFVWEADDSMLVCRGRSGSDDRPRPLGARVGMGPRAVRLLANDPRPLTFEELTALTGLGAVSGVAGFSDGVVMPIIARDTFLGLIAVATSGAERSQGGRHTLLNGIGGIAATAFDNARLLDQIRHQAGHDPLTDIPNQRLLQELVEAALANARRDGTTVALMFVDLDHFKRVNDTFGHDAGDAVLVEAAARLRAAVRVGDTVGRFGGDEFGVLLPRVSNETEITAVAQRILEAFSRPLVVHDTSVALSASIGVAVTDAGTATYADLVKLADGAMYRAKDNGRGRYHIHA